MCKGLTVHLVPTVLTAKGKSVWQDRQNRTHVVVVDHQSTQSNISAVVQSLKDVVFKVCFVPPVFRGDGVNSKLCAHAHTHTHTQSHTHTPLTSLLLYPQYDTTGSVTKEPSILEGGFQKWYHSFGPLCVGRPRPSSSSEGTKQQPSAVNGVLSGVCAGQPHCVCVLTGYVACMATLQEGFHV